MYDAMTETIPATETGAQDARDALTELIPATEAGPQDAALAASAEMIWTGPHPAIAESAEIIWSPAVAATTDNGPAAETARTAGPAQLPATMVEATQRGRGRHAAPRSAGSRPSAAGLARRGEGRHAATRPASGGARRFAMSMTSATMVAAGPSAVAG